MTATVTSIRAKGRHRTVREPSPAILFPGSDLTEIAAYFGLTPAQFLVVEEERRRVRASLSAVTAASVTAILAASP